MNLCLQEIDDFILDQNDVDLNAISVRLYVSFSESGIASGQREQVLI